jgi:hypothetical protein
MADEILFRSRAAVAMYRARWDRATARRKNMQVPRLEYSESECARIGADQCGWLPIFVPSETRQMSAREPLLRMKRNLRRPIISPASRSAPMDRAALHTACHVDELTGCHCCARSAAIFCAAAHSRHVSKFPHTSGRNGGLFPDLNLIGLRLGLPYA